MSRPSNPYAEVLSQVLTRRSAGETLSAICRDLGLPYRRLQSWLRDHGHYRPRARTLLLAPEPLVALLDQGLSLRSCADRLGVSLRTIEKRVREWGLESNRAGGPIGAAHPEWREGRRRGKHGYVDVWAPLHPHARRGTTSVPEHRLVMEVVLGRLLGRREVVHHRDNHPHHNWPDNLQVFATNADHLRAELTARVKASPRSSIPGAYRSRRSTRRCPDSTETLAQCPAEIRARLDYYLASFRPTSAHRRQTARQYLRAGAWRDPFGWASTA